MAPDRGYRRSSTLKIWIDADAAPRDVKELVFRAAKRLGIEVILVAKQRLQTPLGNAFVSAVRVDGGPDVAHQYIAPHGLAGESGCHAKMSCLAPHLFPKEIMVLNPCGEENTAQTIGEPLPVRDFWNQAHVPGIFREGPPLKWTAKKAFPGL